VVANFRLGIIAAALIATSSDAVCAAEVPLKPELESKQGKRISITSLFSGYNTASEGVDFIAPRPQTVAYYAWIDNYCSQNPLNKVMQAVMALKDELTTRARR